MTSHRCFRDSWWRIVLAVLCWGICLGAEVAPGEPVGQSSRQVIVVFKTHFDIGYTDLASNVVQRYRTTMIDDALKVVDQNRGLPSEQQFAWTLPGWPLSKIVEDWPGQTPSRQDRIQAAFRQGRFVVHALPFTTHTELLEPEDMVRGLEFASDLSRNAGLALPRDAKMTDVPCHTWLMPTLLRRAGVDFLHLGCNAASRSPQVPRLFWWEGPDGSRLLTMYTAESYGTGLVPPKDWPYSTWLALIHTGDNHGPPTPSEVMQVLDEAARNLPGVQVRIGRLSDFADAILAEKRDIPVVRGDMPDTWIHGPLCDPQGAKLARHVRPSLGTAEVLGTLLGAWGARVPDASSTLGRAREQSLLYGEHTWGGALYWVTKYGSGTKWGYGETWKTDHAAGRFRRLETSWAEHTAYVETSRDLLQPIEERQLEALARSVGAAGERVVVFNPLPWVRSGLARVAHAKPSGVGVTPEGRRTSLPAAGLDGGLVFTALDLPSLGYQTFRLTSRDEQVPSRKAASAPTVLENAFFKLTLDPARGCIGSALDKRSGRELVDASAAHGFGQYLYERFDSNQVAAYVKAYVKIDADWAINELGKPSLPPAAQTTYRASIPKNCRLEVIRNGVFTEAAMRADATPELPHEVTTRIVLYEDQPYFDVEADIKNKPADPWPEAGWLCLPFNVQQPQFRLGRPGSIIDPANDIITGANRHLIGINTGVAVFDAKGRGAGLCPIDSPLVSLGEPGCWKYSLDYAPRRAAVYINLFNNQWTTNFRLWNQGSWTSRVRVWAFARYEPQAALIRPSLEARFPLQAALADGPAGHLPTLNRGLDLDRAGVLVTAFGPNPDGPGLLLRLWEQTGESSRCRVRLPEGLKATTVLPVNLRGQPESKPLSVRGGTFTAELTGFAPASFVLQQ